MLTIELSDSYTVEQTYVNNDRNRIKFYQSTISDNTSETTSVNSNNRVEDITINNLKIKLISDDENFTNAFWIDNNVKYKLIAIDNITDNKMKKIIEQLK